MNLNMRKIPQREVVSCLYPINVNSCRDLQTNAQVISEDKKNEKFLTEKKNHRKDN
jgi:hypothetical protein